MNAEEKINELAEIQKRIQESCETRTKKAVELFRFSAYEILDSFGVYEEDLESTKGMMKQIVDDLIDGHSPVLVDDSPRISFDGENGDG